jgi:hypothetical protein
MKVELPDSLVAELQETARSQGTSLEELLADLLRVGMDAAAGGSTLERLEAIERSMAAMNERLRLIGPACIGTQRLLTMWATKSKDVQVPEEALQAELEAHGRMEWDLLEAAHGLLPIGRV